MADGNVKEFLSFTLPDVPPWRAKIDPKLSIPVIPQMLQEICNFKKQFEDFQHDCKSSTDLSQQKRKVIRDLLVQYLLNVQREEDIGVCDLSKTEELMELMDTQSKEGSVSTDEFSDEENQPQIQCTPEFEVYPSIEDEISDIHTYVSQDNEHKPKKSIAETKNLYSAFKHLLQEMQVGKQECRADESNFRHLIGLLEISTIIVDTHKKLMIDVMDENKTRPGCFSTGKRCTEYKDQVIHYPTFQREQLTDKAVSTVVDKYNAMLSEIGLSCDFRSETLLLQFKCAAVFLFSFLQLHPFGDGNGRLARLLAGYSLLTFSPFMTPIYNVFSTSVEDDYIQALVTARCSPNSLNLHEVIVDEAKACECATTLMKQQPGDLCAMLIESNWSMWRQLLYRLGDRSIAENLYPWEQKSF